MYVEGQQKESDSEGAPPRFRRLLSPLFQRVRFDSGIGVIGSAASIFAAGLALGLLFQSCSEGSVDPLPPEDFACEQPLGSTISVGVLHAPDDVLPSTSEAIEAIEFAVGEVDELLREGQPIGDGTCAELIKVVEVDYELGPENADKSRLDAFDEFEKQGVDVVFTLEGSAETGKAIPLAVEKQIVLMSSYTTSPDLHDLPDRGLFFRTPPSDEMMGRLLTEKLDDEQKTRAATIYLDGDYGEGVRDEFRLNFQNGDRQVVAEESFKLGDTSFDQVVEDVRAAGPDSLVIAGYARETRSIIQALADAGLLFSDGVSIWSVGSSDVLAGVPPEEWENYDGLKQIVPGGDPGQATAQRLYAKLGYEPSDEPPAYVAEAYDAVILVGLAALQARSSGADAIAANIIPVSSDGESCDSLELCVQAIMQQDNVDYQGVAGDYELTSNGEPSTGKFRIYTYGSDGKPGDPEFVDSELCTLCDVNKQLGSQEIAFGVGESTIDESDSQTAETLDEIAEVLQQPDVGLVEVQGYGDNTGSKEATLQVSQARAEAVRDALIERDVPANKLRATGFGTIEGGFTDKRVVRFDELDPTG